MTLMKYPFSIDSDLKYLFTYFDQRIYVGSDFPEWDYPDLKRRLEYLTHGVPPHKIQNVLINNLLKSHDKFQGFRGLDWSSTIHPSTLKIE